MEDGHIHWDYAPCSATPDEIGVLLYRQVKKYPDVQTYTIFIDGERDPAFAVFVPSIKLLIIDWESDIELARVADVKQGIDLWLNDFETWETRSMVLETEWGTHRPEVLQRVLAGDTGVQAVAELVAFYFRLFAEKEARIAEFKRMLWEEIEEIFHELDLEKKYGTPHKKWREGGWKKEYLAQCVADCEYPTTEIETALSEAGVDVARIQAYLTEKIPRVSGFSKKEALLEGKDV